MAFRSASGQPHRGSELDGEKGHQSSHWSPRHEPGLRWNLMSLFARTHSYGGRIKRSAFTSPLCLTRQGPLQMRWPARCCLLSGSCPSSGGEGWLQDLFLILGILPGCLTRKASSGNLAEIWLCCKGQGTRGVQLCLDEDAPASSWSTKAGSVGRAKCFLQGWHLHDAFWSTSAMEREHSQHLPPAWSSYSSSPWLRLGNLAGKIRAQIHVLFEVSNETNSLFQEWDYISIGPLLLIL